MKPITRYVCGLLFDDEGQRLALIQKRKGPEAVVGRWNGIGGKCETGSAGQHAFSSEHLALVKTMEEEEVAVWPLTAESWSVLNVMPNLRWIVPLANGHKDDHVWIYEVIEKEVFA
jgi:hypothetical protein